MRAVRILIAMLILVLTACTERPKQTSTPTSLAPIPPTPTAAEAPLVVTLSPTTPPTSPPATAVPAGTPTTPVESQLPVFRRALDFGIPAGNSYNPRALAVHPGLGRLYARRRRDPVGAPAGPVPPASTRKLLALGRRRLPKSARLAV